MSSTKRFVLYLVAAACCAAWAWVLVSQGRVDDAKDFVEQTGGGIFGIVVLFEILWRPRRSVVDDEWDDL